MRDSWLGLRNRLQRQLDRCLRQWRQRRPHAAEGRRGRFREAFYPALFEELGFPYTGSDAWALAVTLDKSLTKLMLREHGVVQGGATDQFAGAARPGRGQTQQTHHIAMVIVKKQVGLGFITAHLFGAKFEAAIGHVRSS